MNIRELVKYNKRCQKIDKYFLFKTKKTKKYRKTKNRKNRKTRRKKRTRRILSLNKLNMAINFNFFEKMF